MAGSIPDPMTALMAAMAQLAQGFTNLQQSLSQRENVKEGKKPLQCWNCGKLGHISSRCQQPKKTQENRQGQQ